MIRSSAFVSATVICGTVVSGAAVSATVVLVDLSPKYYCESWIVAIIAEKIITISINMIK